MFLVGGRACALGIMKLFTPHIIDLMIDAIPAIRHDPQIQWLIEWKTEFWRQKLTWNFENCRGFVAFLVNFSNLYG